MDRLFIGIFILFSSLAFADEISILQKTDTYNKGTAFVTELTFDRNIEVNKTSIEYINQTVQLNIRGATIANGKQFKKIEGEQVQSIYTYQFEPEVMRTRVIYKKPTLAKNLEGYVHLSSKDNKLIVTIEDPKAVASQDVKKQLPIIPPVDLNAELEPKATPVEEENLEASAAALLEQEFLNKDEKPAASKKHSKKVGKIEASKQVSDRATPAVKLGGIESSPSSPKELSEADIPLSLSEVKEKKADFNPWTRMLLSLAVIGIVSLALIVFAKKYSKNKNPMSNKIKIKVVSQQSIGAKKNLAVVRVAGEDILIGVTDYNISMIKSLSFIDDEIESDVPQDFVNELNKVTDRYVDSKTTARSKNKVTANHPAHDDDFSMGNIKDMVASKLKEMRPL